MIDASKLKSISDCKGKIKDILNDNDIIALAKNGICPHYLITNPITKEETIWFIPSELNDWFVNTFVQYRQGHFEQKHNFIYFNKYEFKIKSKIPDELLIIDNLFELPIGNIFTTSGIYFLCLDGKIKYIGQAENISARAYTHYKEGIKNFDSVFFITCPKKQLFELENSLIKYFRPEYNIAAKAEIKSNHLDVIKCLSKAAQSPAE
jgi:hypothetical protein